MCVVVDRMCSGWMWRVIDSVAVIVIVAQVRIGSFYLRYLQDAAHPDLRDPDALATGISTAAVHETAALRSAIATSPDAVQAQLARV